MTRNQRRPKQEKPNQTKEQKMKLKTQIAFIVLGLAASTSLVWSADRPSREATPNLVGIWQAVRYGVDCNTGQDLGNSFPALITFHSDGTMTGDTGGATTNEYGSWQREPGSQNYSFREVWYGYDENGVFLYSGVITATVHLTDANSFTYTSTIQFFDADGNLLFTACGRATGTRFQ
jgi:hypothetical protein